jgi:hypothetical protein
VWFQVFYAVKGRDGNPRPPKFSNQIDATGFSILPAAGGSFSTPEDERVHETNGASTIVLLRIINSASEYLVRSSYQLRLGKTVESLTHVMVRIGSRRSCPLCFPSPTRPRCETTRSPSSFCVMYCSRFTGSSDETRQSSSNASAAAAAFRRKSCSGEQSLLSVAIDEADTDTEDCGDGDGAGERTALISHVAAGGPTGGGIGTDVDGKGMPMTAVGGMYGDR